MFSLLALFILANEWILSVFCIWFDHFYQDYFCLLFTICFIKVVVVVVIQIMITNLITCKIIELVLVTKYLSFKQ